MVQVTQTDEEIKIVIELNRLITRKPDIVLLPYYLKFNNPPIFFERHLTQEIDELASFCRIFKSEARLILVKKVKGIWPEIFQKLSKEEAFQKRLEISDQIVERNKERDKQAIERYEQKRRTEIEKEVRREQAMRDRVKQIEDEACREALMVGARKETQAKQQEKQVGSSSLLSATKTSAGSVRGGRSGRLGTPTPAAIRPMATLRNVGKINVCFSNFNSHTPKRESTEGVPMPFTITDNCQPQPEPQEEKQSNLDTVDE